MARPLKTRCPNCGRPPVEDYRPFCSKRCADVDLGRWLDGDYRIPGRSATAEEVANEDDAEKGEKAGDGDR